MSNALPDGPNRTSARPRGVWARRDKPYASAVAWVAAREQDREPRGKKSTWELERIAALPRAWGEKLDALGATHAEARWVAVTLGHEHVALRLARYKALVQLLETVPRERRGPEFRRLVASSPTCDGRGKSRAAPAPSSSSSSSAPALELRALELEEDELEEDELEEDEELRELEELARELEGRP